LTLAPFPELLQIIYIFLAAVKCPNLQLLVVRIRTRTLTS